MTDISKRIQELKQKYFEAGGNTKAIGLRREYLDLILTGLIKPSMNTLKKITNHYEIPLKETYEIKIDKDENTMLIALEMLSKNKEFMKSLRLKDEITKQTLQELILQHYINIHERGRMSTILTNVPAAFAEISTYQDREVFANTEFNEQTIRNPYVKLHKKTITAEEFMIKIGTTYNVKEELLPKTVRSITTDEEQWKPIFEKGTPRREPEQTSNTITIEYKKPINQIIDQIRKEIQTNPEILGFQDGGRTFKEPVLTSRIRQEGNLELTTQTILTIQDAEHIKIHYHPLQIVTSGAKSEGGSNYYPTPRTLKLINLIQNYTEGRKKIKS